MPRACILEGEVRFVRPRAICYAPGRIACIPWLPECRAPLLGRAFDADQPSGEIRFAAEICDGSAARRPTEHLVVTPHALPACLLTLCHPQREHYVGQAVCGCGGRCAHGGEGYRLLHYSVSAPHSSGKPQKAKAFSV